MSLRLMSVPRKIRNPMTIHILIIAAVAIVAATLFYKFMPFGELSAARPKFSLLPKYRTLIDWDSPAPDAIAIEQKFSECGFRLVQSDDRTMHYQRGHLFGDFSVKLMKLKCTITIPENSSSTLTVEAGWMIAFDTGDLWTFTSELREKLQSDGIQTSTHH